jgi:hypothetical protein
MGLPSWMTDRWRKPFSCIISNAYPKGLLRLTQKKIGSYLGMKLETVSHLFSRFNQLA